MGHCGMATFDRRKSAPKHLLMDIYPARSAAAPASERPLWRRALHFEGRSWTGLHRHALMTMIAYAFLQSRRLKAAGRKKRVAEPPPQPSMPAIRQAILNLFARPPPRRCPHCEMLLTETTKKNLPK